MLKRKQEKEIGAHNNETGITEEPTSLLEYKYNLVSKPGDALLQSEDWAKYVSFIGEVESSKLTGNYSSGTDKLFREGNIVILNKQKNIRAALYFP